MNHELHFKAPAQGLEEVEPESAQSVFVGNHNLADTVVEEEVQKGLKTFAAEVEAGPDVFDDSVVGVVVLEVLDLADKVFLLVT